MIGTTGEEALVISKNFTKKVAMGLTSVNVDNVNKTITFTLVADGSQHTLQFDELTTTTTRELVASITQGNIYPGKVYPIGTEYETILEDLITQYLKPEVKLTIEPATTLYDIVNDTVDKITMYGEGNSAKLLSDIVNGTTQVTEGISAGMGIDIKSLIMGALGGKMASEANAPVVVVQPANIQDEESKED